MVDIKNTTQKANHLPEGWTVAELPHVSHIIMGQSPPGKTYNTTGNGLPFFQGKAEFGEIHPTVKKWCSKPNKIAEAGDVLLSIRAPVGPTNVANQKCAIGRGLAAIRPLMSIPTELILYAIRSQENFLSMQGTGSTFTAINKSYINEIKLKLPPLAEQKRIVAKAKKLLARVDLTRQRLANVPAILKRFRQSVLAAACSGRLTEDWREKHPDIEPAGEMVEKLYRLRLSNAKAEKEKKKIGKIYSYKEIEKSDTLPEAWSFVSLSKLCDSFQYGTSKKSLKTGKVPVLRMGNLQEGKIDWGKLKYSSDSKEIKKYELLPDTVLFDRTNSPELVGKTSVYKGERPAIFAGYLIRINNHREFLCSEYLNYCLNTNYARIFCSKIRTDGVSQSNINAQKLASFEVPLCSLREQQEIVRRIEELFALADKIENRVKLATDWADRMTLSILAKAFRGQLVPTEAELARQEGRDYETAQQLLERIQSNRK